MAGNTFGTIFRITTFGESHGSAIGVVIDGCPAGIRIDINDIQRALDRRKPGAADGKQNPAVTSRNESDKAEILSGVFEGVSEGTPIAIEIRNNSQKSEDYSDLAHMFRPGHADYTYFKKYGVRDWRGGGRSSGRETASRVAAGAVANAVLQTAGISVKAYTISAAGISCKARDMDAVERTSFRACDEKAAKEMEARVARLRAEGESAGGIVECTAHGVPAGLGETVFDKLDAELAKAVLSIGGVKGIEFGAGFGAALLTGSENNDAMRTVDGEAAFLSNNSGGILGGISNGNDIVFRAAIKPVPSISLTQETVREEGGAYFDSDISVEGRHDACLCPRIVPVIEAMTEIVLADMLLRNRSARI
ncbi:chorismate synthase [Treponema socranskii subsp. buccale]|uniref:chorismate synthase n=1 Tax=Treponema socranskii TaxID=53419 RepID=UPI0020A5703B|nr:chorismate synthase [Treponema socranskii]UTD02008.1 chorismate synthase [Treponema socranskii subsp. buccale]